MVRIIQAESAIDKNTHIFAYKNKLYKNTEAQIYKNYFLKF